MTRALVTGGAGFLGSHLCRRLLDEGWDVVCVDSLITGSADNVRELQTDPRFRLETHDVTESLDVDGPLHWICHLASPASPVDYLEHPIETLKVGAIGTLRALELARATGAAFLLASTSEVYGDPEIHPQPETYWGRVNPVGPRAVYDEAKRYAEAATTAYRRTHGLTVRIARIFNTYGPRMRRRDGRAVPTFIAQALAGEPLTVHGRGAQTRSLCYVDDLIEGFWRLLGSDLEDPVNLGNPHEVTVLRLAETIRDAIGSSSEITFTERPVDDPEVRSPDLTLARERLGWEPQVPLDEGLKRTVEWAREAWADR
ncbi:MAG TPA: UDP-glucuronic acid decarboxylase family protein [Actinomycetota bacterium]|nr:UDP-glucuronic acid decarboxylase family protein [Actinomycetota bacterium]